jgi:hypothetical protein
MPLHDYVHCGQVLLDVYRTVEQGGRSSPPPCPTCGQPMIWIPGTTAMDVGGVKGAGFKAFDTLDGRNRPVRIDSLRKLRQVERDAERMARNGEGQPMVFRRWAQGESNRDVPTLGTPDQVAPSAAGKRKFGLQAVRKHAEAPERAFGPGVNDSNTSALPMEPQ